MQQRVKLSEPIIFWRENIILIVVVMQRNFKRYRLRMMCSQTMSCAIDMT